MTERCAQKWAIMGKGLKRRFRLTATGVNIAPRASSHDRSQGDPTVMEGDDNSSSDEDERVPQIVKKPKKKRRPPSPNAPKRPLSVFSGRRGSSE